MADSDSDTDDSISSDDDDSAVRTPEQMVKLAKIFIIKINPDDNSTASIAPWDGTKPGINDRLLAYGVKISDNTYDAYTNVSSLIDQKVKRLKEIQSVHRTAEDTRTFDHLHGITENGGFVSCLYGCLANRKPLPYKPPSAWGRTETLQDSLLPNLMKNITRSHRPGYKNKIYVLTERSIGEEVCTSSCWYLVDGHDEYQIGSPYIEEVNILDTSLSKPGNLSKKYCVLDRFLVDDACSYCFGREIGKFPDNPFKRRKPNDVKEAGKSRRRVKRRFKRKTIKRINKRKTIKRRFKNR